MLTLLIVLAFVIVGGFAILLTVAIKTDNQRRKTRSDAVLMLQETEGADEVYVSPFDMSTIAIRWRDCSVFLGSAPDQIHCYPMSDIISAEVELEGGKAAKTNATTRTRRGSQVAGAALGGMVLGPAGLVLGGLSGGSTTKSTGLELDCISRITLTVQVRDRTSPVHRILFSQLAPPGEPKHLVRSILENAGRFQALLGEAGKTPRQHGVVRD